MQGPPSCFVLGVVVHPIGKDTMPEPRAPLMPLQLPGLPVRRLEPGPRSAFWSQFRVQGFRVKNPVFWMGFWPPGLRLLRGFALERYEPDQANLPGLCTCVFEKMLMTSTLDRWLPMLKPSLETQLYAMSVGSLCWDIQYLGAISSFLHYRGQSGILFASWLACRWKRETTRSL